MHNIQLKDSVAAEQKEKENITLLPSPHPVKVAVVGATGYAGAELTNILARHRYAKIEALFSSSGSSRSPVMPSRPDLIAEPFALEHLLETSPAIAFLATPNEVSAELAPKLLDAGIRRMQLWAAERQTWQLIRRHLERASDAYQNMMAPSVALWAVLIAAGIVLLEWLLTRRNDQH